MKGDNVSLANEVLIEELGIRIIIHYLNDNHQNNLNQLNYLN